MGVIESVVRMMRGDVDKRTQVVTWSDQAVQYTSAYMQSVIYFVAREFSKLDIRHRVYVRQEDGKYLQRDKLGSDIYEVLNYAPNGYKTNAEWRRQIATRIMTGATVYLQPIRKNGILTALKLTDQEGYNKAPDDVLAITSSYYISSNASLYDNILTNIGRELSGNNLRGFLKINAAVGSSVDAFKKTALDQLHVMQDVASFNGLGIIDAKADVVELRNEYKTIPDEAVKIIKREILNGFGLSESLLTGEYTEADYRHFVDQVLSPLVNELETELTYKLLTTNARINNGQKATFERVKISQPITKWASMDQIVALAKANTNGAYLTVNEVRVLMGYDPIEGGDVYRTNLNSAEVKYDQETEDDNGN